MEQLDDPTEQDLPQSLEGKQLEHDTEADPMNTIGQATPPPPIKNSEAISLRFNGVELYLGSSLADISMLCNMALALYYELKGIKPKENGGDYIG